MDMDFEYYLGYFPNLKNALTAFLPAWSPHGLGKIDAFVFSQKVCEDGEEWVLVDYADLISEDFEVAAFSTERGLKWFEVSGAAKLRSQNPRVYNDLITHTKFADRTAVEAEIKKDVCRTNRQEDLWTKENKAEKQESLLRVLKAYASFFPQVGYCQGMGCVCAMLLNELGEEYTFWTMVALTIDPRYKLWGLWHPTMPLVGHLFQNMEFLVEKMLPSLSAHFRNQGVISCTMYGVCTWFITVFVASKIPLGLVHDIWDVYMEHGLEFIYQVGLGILTVRADDLLQKNFEEIIRSFQEKVQLDHANEDFIEYCLQEFDIPKFSYDLPLEEDSLFELLQKPKST